MKPYPETPSDWRRYCHLHPESIYCLQCEATQRIKFGKGTDPYMRWYAARGGPTEIRMIAVVPWERVYDMLGEAEWMPSKIAGANRCMHTTERAIHEHFSQYRESAREWYGNVKAVTDFALWLEMETMLNWEEMHEAAP